MCRRTLTMKRKRHTAEEIIKKLREAATLLARGQGVEEVCPKLEVSPPTCHRWRQVYGGAMEETVKGIKELDRENERLERLGDAVRSKQSDTGHVARGPAFPISDSIISNHTVCLVFLGGCGNAD